MTGTTTSDPILDVFADRRLRTVVSVLETAGETLTIRELARRLEAGEPTSSVAVEAVEAVERELYHDCVPRLSEHGFVSFDRDAMTVTLSSDIGRFEAAATAAEERLDTVRD
ncbi:hypothetical protein SAMN05216559_3111 [Halomicrobium zhouii]|uniref:DUF7344 domain-containing protein n=1 Tax=Halomicrobium zhouii TaxID=767519 RepID=A0A1I6LTY2_9EURY|nr:hypothetical protein [Halomicrobium zhouii]SFS06856.1 hypothetical protein SAMN05216559_3111 [Halomicrobium zhouii]